MFPRVAYDVGHAGFAPSLVDGRVTGLTCRGAGVLRFEQEAKAEEAGEPEDRMQHFGGSYFRYLSRSGNSSSFTSGLSRSGLVITRALRSRRLGTVIPRR